MLHVLNACFGLLNLLSVCTHQTQENSAYVVYVCVSKLGAVVNLPIWRSVPRLGLRFGLLRPTFVIYDYSINRNIYRCIWTWLQQACTCVTEMIIRTFSFNHMNKKMLQRIRTVFQVPWRRVENVSGTFCKLLEEYNTKYEERLACYWTKMIQHTRNIIQGSWRSCDNVPGTSCKLLAEDLTTY